MNRPTSMKELPFNQVVNILARDLPSGYSIQLDVELEGGGVRLYARGENEIDYPSNQESVQESVEDALNYARELAGRRVKCCFNEERSIRGGCVSCGDPAF